MGIGLRNWSTTTANNASLTGSADAINWKEGQAPSTVNNSARETLSQIRAGFEDVAGGWFDYGDPPGTRNGAEFSLTGTHSVTYAVGRRLRMKGGSVGTVYGVITTNSISGGNSIIGVEFTPSISLSGTLSEVALSIRNPPLPGRNLITNGAMNVAQRSTSSTGRGTSSGYYVQDRFRDSNEGVGTGRYTWTQTADGPVGFANCIKVDCTTADGTLAAGCNQSIEARLEAQDLQLLAYGNAAAKTITLSFYVKCTSTGTLSVLLRQQDGGRSYHQNYTIYGAGWERKTLVFPGDPSGAMADDNGIGFSIYWSLAAGSNFKGGTSGSWVTHNNNLYGTGDTLNVLGDTATNWFMTGVQLEVTPDGSGALETPFEHEDYATTLAKCQRYFWRRTRSGGTNHFLGMVYLKTTSVADGVVSFPQTMRAAATIAFSAVDDFAVNHNNSAVTTSNMTAVTPGTDNVLIQCTASGFTVGQAGYFYLHTNGDYIQASAEL
jgi:hypothetical protein